MNIRLNVTELLPRLRIETDYKSESIPFELCGQLLMTNSECNQYLLSYASVNGGMSVGQTVLISMRYDKAYFYNVNN
jgi:hypothetical protein